MAVFSKCETYLRKCCWRIALGISVMAIASAAFFIPPELCQFYDEWCKKYRWLIHFDKVFHFGFFACLAMLIPHPRRLWIFVAVLIALGSGIEAIQYFIPDRGMTFPDMIANIAGVLAGTYFKQWIKRRFL